MFPSATLELLTIKAKKKTSLVPIQVSPFIHKDTGPKLGKPLSRVPQQIIGKGRAEPEPSLLTHRSNFPPISRCFREADARTAESRGIRMRRKKWYQGSEGQGGRLEMPSQDSPLPLLLCPLLGYTSDSEALGGFGVFLTGACPVLGLKPHGQQTRC